MTEKAAQTEFDKLVGEMDTLAKALESKGTEEEDEKIEAAMKDGAEGEEEGEEGRTEMVAKDVKKGNASGKKAPLKKSLESGKSLTVTLEDGTTVEAEDGTELVKALTEELGALSSRFEANETTLAKAFAKSVDLLKAQGAAIAELRGQVAKLSNEGRGRKAVVNVVDKPDAGKPMAKGGQDGLNPDEFMAKAMAAWESGKLAGVDLAYVEASFNRGNFDLPAALINKVAAA